MHKDGVIAYERAKEAARKELDNCDHPDCAGDRERTGYSNCAGGYLARRVVAAIAKVERGQSRRLKRK